MRCALAALISRYRGRHSRRSTHGLRIGRAWGFEPLEQRQLLASVGGVAWVDDGDGVRQSTEPKLDHVGATLNSTTRGFIATTQTAADGSYQFAGLAADDYYVQFALPTSRRNAAQYVGGGQKDRDALSVDGKTTVFHLNATTQRTGLDAGFLSQPPTADIVARSFVTNGHDTVTITYDVLDTDAQPFDVGVFLSSDTRFDDDRSVDTFVDSVSISDPADLAVGRHVKSYAIGAGAIGDSVLALPGRGATELDLDYHVLAVLDFGNVVAESDSDALNEDNTTRLTGLYAGTDHSLYFHGLLAADTISVALSNTQYIVNWNASQQTYSATDVTLLRFRSHAGDDSLSASNLAMRLYAWAGDGHDTITGGLFGDIIDGGDGPDTIIPAGGTNTLQGGRGDDTYVYNTDAWIYDDVIDESLGGVDTLDFSQGTLFQVVVDLSKAAPQRVSTRLTLTLGAGDTIENVLGTARDDRITGNSQDNFFAGGAGNDFYYFDCDTALGSDTIDESGGGRDALWFNQTTTQKVSVDLGLSTPQTINANLTLNLGSGATMDAIVGGELDDLLIGNALPNDITGGGGNDRMVGKAGNDRYGVNVDQNCGSDTIVEEVAEGVDTIDASQSLYQGITLSLADATFQSPAPTWNLTLSGPDRIENVFGTLQGDRLTGNSLNNVLRGGGGDDSYFFDDDTPQGNDTIDDPAAGGADTIDFSATTTKAVRFDLSNFNQQLVSANQKLMLAAGTELENLVGGSLNDYLTGNALNNRITGGPGDDWLAAGAGNDSYVFDADFQLGTDTLVEDPNGGIDALDFSPTNSIAVNVNLSLVGTQTVNSRLRITGVGEIENLIGGDAADTLTGNARDNRLVGGPGDDLLMGLAGNDTYEFAAQPPLGTDTVDESVDNGIDALDFSQTYADVAVNLSLTSTQVVSPNLSLRLTGGDRIEQAFGGYGNDKLTGNALDNDLVGSYGADVLAGLAGNDHLAGGLGNDTYVFDVDSQLGSDFVDEPLGSGVDALDFSASVLPIALDLRQVTQAVNANLNLVFANVYSVEVVLGGAGADTITANILGNAISGNGGNDTLIGDEGEDILIGGAGADLLRGGDGHDVLIGDQTDFDANVIALMALVAEWGRNATFQARIDHLTGVAPFGLNGSYFLTPSTVHNKPAIDRLLGENYFDWFWVGTGDTLDVTLGEVTSNAG